MIVLWLRAARRLRRMRGGDEGSAIVEFVFLGVLVTLPVFYLVVALSRVQAGSYAVSMAARESGRTFVTAPQNQVAGARAQEAARLAFSDQGFAGQGSVEISCSANPCLTREATVSTRSRLEVGLPLVPGFLSGIVPTSITVTATHVETVDRFGEVP
ncbi:pilus assembly protein [Dermacoccaceae bacterium W4C1]